MSIQTPFTPKPNSVRRRLLRGAFAVPAVITVHSGSALANSSNPLCRTQSSLAARVTDALDEDTFKRVELGRLGDGYNANYFVDVGNVFDMARVLGVYVASSFIPTNTRTSMRTTRTSDQRIPFDIVANRVIDKSVTASSQSPETGASNGTLDQSLSGNNNSVISGWTTQRQSVTPQAKGSSAADRYTANGGKFAVLMFDETGSQIVGVGNMLGANALTDSCLASINPQG